LDPRTFLKLGVTGTAAAAINPSMGLASVRATRTLSSPPTLVDMASDRLTYRLRDLFNCPVAMNEWGYAQVAKSVSAITAISFRLTLVAAYLRPHGVTKDGAQREKA